MKIDCVNEHDGLSEIMCKKCLARMRVAYEFKKQAESSDRHLRSFISDVNKKFKQVTSIRDASAKAKQSWNSKRDNSDQDATQSSDDLDEDIEALLNEDDNTTYATFDSDAKKTIPREQLVEILGESNSSIQKTSSKVSFSYSEDNAEGEPQEMEVLLLDEPSVDESMDNVEYLYTNDMASDDEDTQYLIYDTNDDALTVTETKPSKPEIVSPSSSLNSNPSNQCDKCHKTFSTRTNLTRHMITHDGRKPYTCHICGNSFTQNGSLKSHMYIHTGERPYQCTECPKAFTQSKSLTFHMRRHTGEKPFKCDHCGVKFRQKDGLKRHVAAKHLPQMKKVYGCDLCGTELLSKTNLKLHRAKHNVGKDANEDMETESDSNMLEEIKNENDKEEEEEWDEQSVVGCQYCEEAFTSIDDLLQHRTIHPEANES